MSAEPDDVFAAAAEEADDLLEYLQEHAPDIPQEKVHVPAWNRRVILRGMTARERDRWEADAIERAQRRAEARATAAAGNGGGNRAERRAAGSRRERLLAVAQQFDLENFRSRLVAATIWSPGRGRYMDNDRGRELLGRQPSAVLATLFQAAQRVNGMNQEDVEDMEKNYGDAADDGGSSSESPPGSDAPLAN